MTTSTGGSEVSELPLEREPAWFMRCPGVEDGGKTAAVLTSLLGDRLGRPVDQCGAGEVLALARDEGLPLLEVEEVLVSAVPPEWAAALSAEAAARVEHRVTAELAGRAIGSLAPCCAWAQPPWRRGLCGLGVELLVPAWALGEVAARLAGAGLVHLSGLDSPGSALLVRLSRGSVADVVTLRELAPAERPQPRSGGDPPDLSKAAAGAPKRSPGVGELGEAAFRRRARERMAGSEIARLVDLADLELAAEPGRGEPARGEPAQDEPAPPPGAAQPPAGRSPQSSASRAGAPSPNEHQPLVSRRLGVVAFTGPGAARSSLAEQLAHSLSRAGIASRTFRVDARHPAQAERLARRAVREQREGVLLLVEEAFLQGAAPRTRVAPRLPRPLKGPAADLTVVVAGGAPLDARPGAGDEAAGLGSGAFTAGARPAWLSDAGVPVIVPPGREAADEVLLAVLRCLLVREETVGRHPGLWRVLLPLDIAGPVVVANLGRIRTENLQNTYPDAVSLAEEMGDLRDARRGVVWDGRRAPFRQGSVGLVVADDRDGRTLEALRGARHPGAGTAALVRANRKFDYVVYPHADYPLLITRQEWPTWTAGSSVRLRLARFRVRTPLWRLTGRDGLRVEAAGVSLATTVLGDVAERSGEPAALQGVLVGRGRGQMTLRARLGQADVAVRLALTPRGVERLRAHETAQRRLHGQEERFGFSVPRIILAGEIAGVDWVAEEWLAGRSGPGGRAWATRGGWGWDVTSQAAVSLARELPTGNLGAGWAPRWAAPLCAVAPDHFEEIVEMLEPVERSGMETAWSHGDLWPGNVFLRGREEPPLIIDWDRGRDDAPAGLDAVFLEVVRISLDRKVTVGAAAAALVMTGGPALDTVAVGGRMWSHWPAPVRHGLVAAAFLRTASGGSVLRPTWSELWLEENLRPLLAAGRLVRLGVG